MNASDRAVAAVFDDPERARAAYERLRTEGFVDAWMAITRPADSGDDDAPENATPLERPVRHDVADASDGVLGTIGRFFTGEGNSLRRSLEDHGVDPLEAVAIDERLDAVGAVVTVIPHEHALRARDLLASGGGRFTPPAAEPGDAALAAPLAIREPSHAPVIVSERAAPPAIFYERRPATTAVDRRAARDEERKGLDDLL